MYAMIPVLWQNVKTFTVDSRNPSHDYKDFPRSLLPLRAAGVNPAPSGRPCLVFSALSLRSLRLSGEVVFLFASGFAGSGSGCSAARQFRDGNYLERQRLHQLVQSRSEERRGGREWKSRGGPG